ncbi:MAG: fumarylacetoacetate hydrolase family protein [Pseudomonadota bacterium]
MDVIAPADIPRLSIVGSGDTFPIRRIFCVGRNYEAHAAEMGSEVVREAPFYFTKSHDAVCLGDAPYAPGTENYHHEFEFVLAIGSSGASLAESDALAHVWGYTSGLDMTRRDLQAAAKKKSLPWDTAKDVAGSCVLAPLTPASSWTLGAQRIHLKVNGETRQDARLTDMIWSVPEIISHLSTLYTLQPGDIIMTGTPAGVGAVAPGDRLDGSIDGLAPLSTTIGPYP